MTELRDFYAALVESCDDAIVAKNTDGIVIAWNPAAQRLFGWTSEEMVGGSIRRLLPPDRQEEEDQILARIRAGERVPPFYTKRLHKDGHLLDVQVSVSPVRDASGTIIGASKLARDVGEYLRVQEAVRESEERFRTLAENISQFAWMAEPNGHIFWFNKRWYEFTGLTDEETMDQRRRKVVHPDYRKRVVATYLAAIAAGEDYEDTFPMRGKDGEYCWFLSRAKPIRNGTGEIVRWFGTNTDITQQREQAEQIRLLLMEVNHRSKNMLTTIQALARRSAPGEEGFLARFEDRVQSLAINQDILVGREWREVPIDELVQLQLAFIHDAPGEFVVGGPPISLAPRAAEVIGMAMHELATNSLKYGALSTEDGSVDIGWSHRPDGAGLMLWWRESGGPAVVRPQHSGFGTTLIRDVPQHNLGAEVTLHFHPGGVCWELICDSSALAKPVPVDA
uniref:PAS domain S-box protein n=1 Tax=Altererythrobacter segetis TaxID=1104773 RepID=UPI00140C0EC5|nr:PAS domain S-box protein [Altererythrobacter segetis]